MKPGRRGPGPQSSPERELLDVDEAVQDGVFRGEVVGTGLVGLDGVALHRDDDRARGQAPEEVDNLGD